MSHFAEIDGNGLVQRVIVAEQDFIDSGVVGDTANWIQTSYNHNIRKQFAGVGYTYDKVKDIFVAPQPFASWALDGNNDWQPPVARPDDDKMYRWDEDTTNWVEIPEEE